jgi:hypothetical protein
VRSRIPAIVATVVTLVFIGSAGAADAYVYESSIQIPQPAASPTDPGQAIFKSDVRFVAIDSVCLYLWFNPADPLDPGEELRFTPNSWLDTNPYAAGPGFVNVGDSAQTFRALCPVNYPGYPLDPFIAEFLDGKQVLKLQTSGGSVLIERIDIEIIGSTG